MRFTTEPSHGAVPPGRHTHSLKRPAFELIAAPLRFARHQPQKIDRIGASGAFTFAVVISLAVEWDRPQINLDDLIKEFGLDPRSR
jgi:hypothetical protein